MFLLLSIAEVHQLLAGGFFVCEDILNLCPL
jgi:hypothetical protein